jgi:hypothetical protein
LFSTLVLADGLEGVSNVPVYDGVGVLVSPLATVTGNATFDGGYVIIETNLDATNDRIQMRSSYTLPAGVTTSYDTANGVFQIVGTGISSANLQSVIRNVEYINLLGENAVQSERRLNVIIGNKIAFSGNGHFYDYIAFDPSLPQKAPGRSWTTARNAAATNSYFGLTGYLGTITSASEMAFVVGKVSGVAWLGATDTQTEGTFRWVTGPEAGTLLSSGYTNWNGGEPNNHAGVEDYVHMMTWTNPPGRWNDLPNLGGSSEPYKATGYIVEYNGTPSVSLTGVATLQVNGPSVVISAPNYTNINADVTGPIVFTVTYDNVTASQVSLAQSDVSLSTTGTAAATPVLSGSGLARVVTVSNVSGKGDITLNIAAGSAANNGGSLSSQASQSFRRECFQVTAVNVDDFGVERETSTTTDACFVYH